METGNNLIAALDPNDSVGIIDSYFPEAAFFTEFERFDRHIEKLKRAGTKIDYVTICSPNYLHDAHIRFGLRHGADVICEKPMVLNPWNVEALMEIEKDSGKIIYNILQLRLHKSVISLKQKVDNGPKDKIYDIDLTYLTSRGNWYYASWKGDLQKSGGIATNIGVHFFDMLIWIFGDVRSSKVHLNNHDRAAGYLELENARVKWFLGINHDLIPQYVKETGQRTFRSLIIEDEEFKFNDGFERLHIQSYEEILKDKGYRINEIFKTISLLSKIRNARDLTIEERAHSLSKKPLSVHPFKS